MNSPRATLLLSRTQGSYQLKFSRCFNARLWKPRTTQLSEVSKLDAVGGAVGALVFGLLAGLSAFLLHEEVFYVTIARKLGLVSPELTGWLIHFLVGLITGGVFIAITALIKKFALDTRRKSFWVGLLGGIAIWVVVYVPVADLLVPTDLSNLMFAGGSFVFHLVYGVVTAVVSLWLIRRSINPGLIR